ncbi:Uncharacterised protein [Enterobacter hormaechei]|uniref:hypothetical protein n=1 Tax=Enterobacteriaceae TaxID=543 RepID=UPI00098126DC|nr:MULTISPECIES: hypothetical protein [Enterobacteriaceae]MDU1983679.1 hypothetical protein [Streptococcus parasanguinis]OOB84790.1 hypothetical protein BZY71_22915 [Leclercia adecarboxylata]VAE21440.1 Uncharacterised protein [Enterobacter hormaechei]VAE26975.1 Uncharacterised protein [Enterobacter hormaechei]
MSNEVMTVDRRAMLAKIDVLMQQTEVLIVELTETYEEGKFGASHPRTVFTSMRRKFVQLRRDFLRAKL